MKLFVHVLRELCGGFAFTVGGFFVLTLPAIAVSAVHKLEGVQTEAILRYMPLVAAGLAPYIVPLSFLLTTVATFGRLAADNEWTAVRMSGRHPLVILLPGAVFAAVLGIATLWLLSDFLPDVRRKEKGFAARAISETFRHLSPGRTDINLKGFYLDAKFRDGDDFLDAFLHVPSHKGEPARTLVAERVHFEFDEAYMEVHLHKARTVIGETDLRVENPVLRFALEELSPTEERKFSAVRYKRTKDIEAELARGGAEPARERLLRYEIHYRRALASTLGLFLLLGASTGLILRRGTQLAALAVAVGYALVFYLFQMRLSKQLAESGLLPPEICAWCVPLVALGAGIVLARRALWR